MLGLLQTAVLVLVACTGMHTVLGRPLGYNLNLNRLSETVTVERRGHGCGTEIGVEERREMEEALINARTTPSLSLYQDLETRGDHWHVQVVTDLGERGGRKASDEKDKEIKVLTLTPVSFDVYWHVVYANETKEGGYVSDEQIKDQMRVMNEDFKSTHISWTLKNITRILNPDWFTNVWPGSAQEQEMKRTYHKGDSSVLNIFTAQFNSTTRSLGFASLPSTYLRQPLSDGLIIRHSTLPGGSQTNYNHGRTTVHELGHWLGLYHTFEGGCEGVGDNIADTAPEAHPSEGCPVGRKSCPGSQVEDPIHNFMDYSWDTCMTHFTPGQAERMHEVIWAFRTKRRAPQPASTAVSSSFALRPAGSTIPGHDATTVTSTSSSPVPSNRAPSLHTEASNDEPENKPDDDERSWYDDEEQRAWEMDEEEEVRDWDAEDLRGWYYEPDEHWYI